MGVGEAYLAERLLPLTSRELWLWSRLWHESSVTSLPLGSKAMSAGKAQAVSLHGTSYTCSLPKGEGQTHAHLGPSPGHGLYLAGSVPPHNRGLHQGEPKVLAGPEQAKPYDQDRPTRDPPETLCAC